MKKLLVLLLFIPFLLALTVTDVVTPGRTVDGNMVSDYDEDGETPIFGNVQGTGGTTIVWNQVTTDTNGNPITVKNYELRYRLVGNNEYILIVVPGEFTGHSLTLSAGSYEGLIEAVDTSGLITTTAATFNFTVN